MRPPTRDSAMTTTRTVSRRSFLASSGKGAAAATLLGAAPAIVPATVFGKTSPSNRINVAAIGVGRISRDHDMPETLVFDSARVMAVCDLDRHRLEDGKRFVNDF